MQHFLRLIAVFAAGVFILALAPAEAADSKTLSAREWRSDLAQLAKTIEETHPRPFAHTSRTDFEKAVARLDRDIPRLSDKEIIARMAAIVGLIHDGHTRLALPRDYPAIGLEFGHTTTPAPKFPALNFRQLPLAFEKFDDGVYVVAADANHASAIGKRLVSIGAFSAEEALSKAAPFTYAENGQLEALMGADLLSLPELLAAAGVTSDADTTPVTLRGADGQDEALSLSPLDHEPDWRRARPGAGGLGPEDMDKRKLWVTYLPESNAFYVEIDEIGDGPDRRFADFVLTSVRNAKHRDARLIIDLRNNFGGSNDLNRTLVLAVVESAKLNRIGKVFVLTGPRTFSAAQMLTNELERYTWALFAGEPTGSRPDHFGDAKKTQLQNSGLTLRVSSLHWSSALAGDARDATAPDLPAPWTSQAYFGGGDPALEAALSFNPATTYIDLTEAALRRGDHYQIARYLLFARTAPQTYADDFSGALLSLGKKFEAEGEIQLASYAYRYGLAFFPEDAALTAALTALGDQN